MHRPRIWASRFGSVGRERRIESCSPGQPCYMAARDCMMWLRRAPSGRETMNRASAALFLEPDLYPRVQTLREEIGVNELRGRQQRAYHRTTPWYLRQVGV